MPKHYTKLVMAFAALSSTLLITVGTQHNWIELAAALKTTKTTVSPKKVSRQPQATTQSKIPVPASNATEASASSQPERLEITFGAAAPYFKVFCMCHCREIENTWLCPTSVEDNVCSAASWYHFEAEPETNCNALEGVFCSGYGTGGGGYRGGQLADCSKDTSHYGQPSEGSWVSGQ
ncbi:MAG TPA: hypothetical protein VJB10_01585 [Candidatus Peribacteraceae bacterium]|nr:hypothetical protein [Candidatus Peribacteraceae bacterium]